MNPIFVAKVKYTKQVENGSIKRVNESYLIEAMTFGHAEERIFEQLNHIKGEVFLDDLKRIDFSDAYFGYVSGEEVPLFVTAKIAIVTYDSEAEKDVSQPYKFLIRVRYFSEAEGYLSEMIDAIGLDISKVETQAITTTRFVDYFPMGEMIDNKLESDVKVSITAPDGTTIETDMKGLKNGLNESIKNRVESLTDSED